MDGCVLNTSLSLRNLRVSADIDHRAVIVSKLEDGLQGRGWILHSELQGFDRFSLLRDMLGVQICGPDLLLAIFDRAGYQSFGKVFVPDNYLEDKIQGKVALVLAVGPLVNGPEVEAWFGGNPPKVGDWVVTSIRDGLNYVVNNVVMKTVEWKYIRMKILHPDMVS
jgi:hypothetical protein